MLLAEQVTKQDHEKGQDTCSGMSKNFLKQFCSTPFQYTLHCFRYSSNHVYNTSMKDAIYMLCKWEKDKAEKKRMLCKSWERD